MMSQILMCEVFQPLSNVTRTESKQYKWKYSCFGCPNKNENEWKRLVTLTKSECL